MKIKYEIQTIKNSQGTGEERRFARIYEHEPITADQLEEDIQTACSLTKADVEAALLALSGKMISELSQGNRFHLPGVGYFSLGVDLDIPEGQSAEKARANHISVRNIRFRPEASMLQEVKTNVHFERAKFSTQSRVHAESEMAEQIKNYLAENVYLNRGRMESLFHLRRVTALKWLKHFTETGLLKKEGTRNSPIYFLND